MADIVESDVKLYKSEDQTDTDTGGGRMSSDVVVSGEINNLFPNISRLDRLRGRIQFRKVFQKIDSENTAVYSGAHLIVRDMPLDPNVSVLMFETNDHNDHLPDIVDYVEDYYQPTVPAGNAGLFYAVEVGEQMLVFKIRHYEYTPHYDKKGRLDWISKQDSKFALNLTVGDMAVFEEGETSEKFHVAGMERVTEELDNADDKHYYIVEYVIITLSAPLMNPFSKDTIPKRVKKNPAWQSFGTMMLARDLSAGQTKLQLYSTKARLIPVIMRLVNIRDQAFFGPPKKVNNVAVGIDGIDWTVDQADEIQVSESIEAVSGKNNYTKVLENKPLKDSTLEVWYQSNGGWFVITEASRVLSGDGSGSISEDGILSLTLDEPPDPESYIMLFYTRVHDMEGHESIDLTAPDATRESEQTAVPAEQDVTTGTFSIAPVQAGYCKLFIDEGSGWVEFGTDSGEGVITGAGIEAASVDYYFGAWEVDFQSPYTSGVTLKWEYVPLVPVAHDEYGAFSGSFNGKQSGSVSLQLPESPVQEGNVQIRLSALFEQDN